VKKEDKKDSEFRTNFKNKIDELQKDDNSKFEEKVEKLLKKGLDGNTPIKYPVSKAAIKNLKKLLLPALDKYCDIHASMWPLIKDKTKILKDIKNIKFEKFDEEFKDKKTKNWQKEWADKWKENQTSGSDKEKESEMLEFLLKDLEYPKNAKDMKMIVGISTKVFERIY